ncbi:hypothetical protein [Lolliginicoccus suaedae]|uniref:hypothetical protein n=1 Tax=Lolliginicoccus suaedae TaxID=2605429 RepID=UPI0011EC4D48|nr:hypothetical protein [Lolliginicoccus suaedae]
MVLVLALVNGLAGWLPVLLIVAVLGIAGLLRVSEADLAWQRIQARRARKLLAAATKRSGPRC